MMKVIAKQCTQCNLIVLLDNYNKLKSGLFGRKATCKHCDKVKRELENHNPYNDKIWNERNLPGANNALLNPNLERKYTMLCDSRIYSLYIKYPSIPLQILSEIFVDGFELGVVSASEVFAEEAMKDVFL
jgi:hypothetical protein